MFSLKNHPFAVEAFFDYSIVLSYAVPKKAVEGLLPNFLSLDLWQDEFAFFTIALVKVRNLRPKGFPEILGQDFHLIGHRLFVKYQSVSGKRLRGLYILKSQTDKQSMVSLGNLMTHYKYEKVRIATDCSDSNIVIDANETIAFSMSRGNEDTLLPRHSPFDTWKEARRFAGPLPFTFSALSDEKVLIVEGVRSNWKPVPLQINSLELKLDAPFLEKAVLANAFIVENIPYHWKKGRVESW